MINGPDNKWYNTQETKNIKTVALEDIFHKSNCPKDISQRVSNQLQLPPYLISSILRERYMQMAMYIWALDFRSQDGAKWCLLMGLWKKGNGKLIGFLLVGAKLLRKLP